MNHSARDIWHTIRRCPYCRERFGTEAALKLHKPKPADKRSRQLKDTGRVRRSLCASEKTMLRAGAWRGYQGIWFTVREETEDPEFVGSQAIENKGANLDKIAYRDSAMSGAKK